jgi:hypothetical protein
VRHHVGSVGPRTAGPLEGKATAPHLQTPQCPSYFARNHNWEALFDRLIAFRESELPKLGFTIQVSLRFAIKFRTSSKRHRAPALDVSSSALRTSKSDNLIGAKNQSPNIARCCRNGASTVPSPMPAIFSDFPAIPSSPSCATWRLSSASYQSIFWSSSRRCPDRRTIKSSCKRVLEEPAPRFASSPVVGAGWEEAWDSFYTPEHVRTILRRSAACKRGRPKTTPSTNLWFLFNDLI